MVILASLRSALVPCVGLVTLMIVPPWAKDLTMADALSNLHELARTTKCRQSSPPDSHGRDASACSAMTPEQGAVVVMTVPPYLRLAQTKSC